MCTLGVHRIECERGDEAFTLYPADVAQRLPSVPKMAALATLPVPTRLSSTYACQVMVSDISCECRVVVVSVVVCVVCRVLRVTYCG